MTMQGFDLTFRRVGRFHASGIYHSLDSRVGTRLDSFFFFTKEKGRFTSCLFRVDNSILVPYFYLAAR